MAKSIWKRRVLYRLEVNYLSRDYEDSCCEVSSPIYNKKDGWKEYKKALSEMCIDVKTAPARVHFWKYNYDANGVFAPITIAKNY